MKKQQGFATILVIIIGLIAIGGGTYLYIGDNNKDVRDVISTSESFSNTSKDSSPVPVDSVQPPVSELPNIIKNISENLEAGWQKPENDSLVVDQVRKEVLNGNLLWFKNPVEVSKQYGASFGIESDAEYIIEETASLGDHSGLWHSVVLATSSSNSYRIYLIANPVEPLIWIINTVSDVEMTLSATQYLYPKSASGLPVDVIFDHIEPYGSSRIVSSPTINTPKNITADWAGIVDFVSNSGERISFNFVRDLINKKTLAETIDSVVKGGFFTELREFKVDGYNAVRLRTEDPDSYDADVVWYFIELSKNDVLSISVSGNKSWVYDENVPNIPTTDKIISRMSFE
ncbi:MAG: hypothetical protein ACI9GH_000312 [Candidatus Paceibacteria bacterium]|jgi:hypothetical protein